MRNVYVQVGVRTAHSFIVYSDVCMPVRIYMYIYICMHMLACLQETFSPERPQNAQSFLDIGSGQSVGRPVHGYYGLFPYNR
eukprot:COSAG05_NODE_294_length_11993_cov_75.643181_10_plen_82_part_00